MDKRKKSKELEFILSIAVLLFFSCSSDCDNTKIGTIEPPVYIHDYAVYEQGETFMFSNEQGETYRFLVNIFEMPGRVNITEIGSGSDPSNGSFSCYEYMSTYGTLIQLEDPSERNTLQLQFLTFGDTEQSLEYILNLSAGWNDLINDSNEVISGWAQMNYSMTKNRFVNSQDQTFSAQVLDEWEGNNLSFTNVINISSLTNELFFKDGVGFIGFTRNDGDLYTLVQ